MSLWRLTTIESEVRLPLSSSHTLKSTGAVYRGAEVGLAMETPTGISSCDKKAQVGGWAVILKPPIGQFDTGYRLEVGIDGPLICPGNRVAVSAASSVPSLDPIRKTCVGSTDGCALTAWTAAIASRTLFSRVLVL